MRLLEPGRTRHGKPTAFWLWLWSVRSRFSSCSSLDHADLELQDFEPPAGTERVREFWDRHWADRSPRTRKKILSFLRDFVSWAMEAAGIEPA
jgi:hypothetical protein